jgi:hypothetical protein
MEEMIMKLTAKVKYVSMIDGEEREIEVAYGADLVTVDGTHGLLIEWHEGMPPRPARVEVISPATRARLAFEREYCMREDANRRGR